MADSAIDNSARSRLVRMALIPLLVVVLGAVCFWPDGRDDQAGLAPLADAAAVPTDQSDGPPSVGGAGDGAGERQFSPMGLTDIVAYDPFSLPATLGDNPAAARTPTEIEATAEDREQMAKQRLAKIVEQMRQQRVNVVFQDEAGVAARLGNRVVREGDELEAGVRIKRITPQGLTLEVTEEIRNPKHENRNKLEIRNPNSQNLAD